MNIILILLFEEHATVPLVYKTKYVTMFITGRYAGEGIVILDHKWKDTTKMKYDFEMETDESTSVRKIVAQIKENSDVLEFGPGNGE